MSIYDDSPLETTTKMKKGPKQEDRTMAMFCHLGGIFGGFILPLIIWVTKKEESSFIDHHGKEALNFQITMMIAHLVAGMLACFTLFISTIAVAAIAITFSIIAAMAANRGERYSYPMTIRFIS